MYGMRVDYNGKTHYYAGLTEVKSNETADEAMKRRFKQHLQKNTPIGFIISQVGVQNAYLTPIEPMIENKRRGEAEVIETASIQKIQNYCRGRDDSIRVNLHDNTQNFITLDPNDDDTPYILGLMASKSPKKPHKSGFKRGKRYEARVMNEKRNWAELRRVLTHHFNLRHSYPIIVKDPAFLTAAGYSPTSSLNVGNVTHFRRKLGI